MAWRRSLLSGKQPDQYLHHRQYNLRDKFRYKEVNPDHVSLKERIEGLLVGANLSHDKRRLMMYYTTHEHSLVA